VRIGAGAVVEAGATVGPLAVIGAGATVAAGASLTRTVVWPHARATGALIDAIVTPHGVTSGA
jgi:mannose-1-phosphate guanylyltransferase